MLVSRKKYAKISAQLHTYVKQILTLIQAGDWITRCIHHTP